MKKQKTKKATRKKKPVKLTMAQREVIASGKLITDPTPEQADALASEIMDGLLGADAARKEAAREVLEHVFLAEKNFDLEALITEKVEVDAAEHVWVTVKLHVPALDIDAWLDGTHLDHPDNKEDEP